MWILLTFFIRYYRAVHPNRTKAFFNPKKGLRFLIKRLRFLIALHCLVSQTTSIRSIWLFWMFEFCFGSSVYKNPIRTRNVKCTYILCCRQVYQSQRRTFAHKIQFSNWNPLIKIDERNNKHPDVSNIYLIWRHFRQLSVLLFYFLMFSIRLFCILREIKDNN